MLNAAAKEQKPLELNNIPRILSLLVDENGQPLSNEMIESINKKAKEERKVVGIIGVELGYYDQEELYKKLSVQSALKAEAAVKDINTIADSGTQTAESWLKANWGNNGVNNVDNNALIESGASAAANIAQNLVMLANGKPEIAGSLKLAVSACANLARGIAEGTSDKVPLKTHSENWIETAKEGLRKAVKETGCIENEVLEKFITARFNEVNAGVQASITRAPTQQQQGGSKFQ